MGAAAVDGRRAVAVVGVGTSAVEAVEAAVGMSVAAAVAAVRGWAEAETAPGLAVAEEEDRE